MVANDSLRIVASMPASFCGPKALLVSKIQTLHFLWRHAGKLTAKIKTNPAFWFFNQTKIENSIRFKSEVTRIQGESKANMKRELLGGFLMQQ